MAKKDPIKPHWNDVARDHLLKQNAAIVRGPVEWSWDITNRCTGRCLHCFNRSGVVERDELSHDEMTSVAEQIAALKPLGLCFCGGEPLLELDNICRLGPGIAAAGAVVNMVTNGMLVTKEVAARLSQPWLNAVQVSLDGATAATHERLRQAPGSLQRVIHAIELLRAAGVAVGVSFTPTRQNIHQWRAVFELCRERGVTSFRMQPLMPLGQANLHYDELAPTTAQYRDLLQQYSTLAEACDDTIKVEWGDPVDHLIRFGQFYAMTPYLIHVTSDGYLVPSVYLPLSLGNVRRHSIDEYWQAGMSSAWEVRLVREMAYRVRSNRDFRRIFPVPYFDRHIDLDLIDLEPARREEITERALELMERLGPQGARPAGPRVWRPESPRVASFMESTFGDLSSDGASGA